MILFEIMDVGRLIRRQLSLILAPMLGLSLSAYFAYNLVGGERGLVAWTNLSQALAEARDQAATVKAERQALERRVAMLQPQHIEPDLLDEQARAALNLVGPNDVVILTPNEPPPAK
jgi:cell division protein FtsB